MTKQVKKYLTKQIEQATEDGWLRQLLCHQSAKTGMTYSKTDNSPKKTRINTFTGASCKSPNLLKKQACWSTTFITTALQKFFFNHAFRTYWWELDFKKFDLVMRATEEAQGSVLSDEEIRLQALKNSSSVVEICNAQLDPAVLPT